MVLAFKCLSEGVALERWSARQSRNLTRVKGQIRRIEYLNAVQVAKKSRKTFSADVDFGWWWRFKEIDDERCNFEVAHIEYAHKRLAFIMQASGEKWATAQGIPMINRSLWRWTFVFKSSNIHVFLIVCFKSQPNKQSVWDKNPAQKLWFCLCFPRESCTNTHWSKSYSIVAESKLGLKGSGGEGGWRVVLCALFLGILQPQIASFFASFAERADFVQSKS